MIGRFCALGALLLLAACGRPEPKSADKFAGLDAEIRTWREGILASSPLCKTADQKCESFEVVCKAERDLTPEDQVKGVTAHVVAAMRFAGFDPQMKQAQTGAETVAFKKTAAGWTRTDRGPVNLSTCGDIAG